MDKKLHILLLEDVLTDAELIKRELQKGDFPFLLKQVKTEDTFQKALVEFNPDIILADYKLPLFDGISALRIVEKGYADIPFIFISGYRGEELAVETLKNGAKDYILKDNLSRLVPSVRLALSEREEQRKRKQAEEELQKTKRQMETIFQTVADGIIVYNHEGKLLYANDVGSKFTGFSSVKKMLEISNITTIWENICKRFEIKDEFDNPFLLDELPGSRVFKGESNPEVTISFKDKVTDNTYWLLIKSRPIFDEQGKVQMVVEVISDISEHKKQEKRKDEFIIAASHELKTPITSLKAFTQFLGKLIDKNEDKEYKRYIVKIDRQADKLTKLITDLLNLSKIQAGKIEFHKEHFDFNKWIKEIVGDMQTLSNGHKIIVKGRITRKVFGDQERLSQIITNFLSNAVKYSPGADKVVIKLSEDKDKAIIAIQDFGIGIEQQYQDKIFDRFFRIHDRDEKTFPGLGMGLYISCQIIKQHDGQIWVESEKGKGSTFYFTIPFKANTIRPSHVSFLKI